MWASLVAQGVSACNAGDLGFIPELGRSPGERSGNTLQYSCLENPMDGEDLWAIIQGFAESWTRLSNFTHSLRYADDTTLMAESEEELKSPLMKVKEESEKFGLKLNIQRTKIVASGPITSWQIDGETVETVADFIFLVSKITADGDGSHEIKRCLLLGRKVMTNLDSILQSRDITLLTKVCLVKAMVFPVIMYGCENWTIKKAEHQRIDTFELWCWRRLLRVPWTEGDPTSPS